MIFVQREKPKVDYYEWHRWFAWYPVSVELADGRNGTAWWELVERRAVSWYGGSTTYRYRQMLGTLYRPKQSAQPKSPPKSR